MKTADKNYKMETQVLHNDQVQEIKKVLADATNELFFCYEVFPVNSASSTIIISKISSIEKYNIIYWMLVGLVNYCPPILNIETPKFGVDELESPPCTE